MSSETVFSKYVKKKLRLVIEPKDTQLEKNSEAFSKSVRIELLY